LGPSAVKGREGFEGGGVGQLLEGLAGRSQGGVEPMLVLDPAAFGGLEKFQHEVDAMVDYLHTTTPARDLDKVRVPGEPERESMSRRLAEGIPIDENTWAGVVKSAETVGLSASQISELTV
jgi:LDH2 family malate/lactate/ureidoglycolate dehydrogenase